MSKRAIFGYWSKIKINKSGKIPRCPLMWDFGSKGQKYLAVLVKPVINLCQKMFPLSATRGWRPGPAPPNLGQGPESVELFPGRRPGHYQSRPATGPESLHYLGLGHCPQSGLDQWRIHSQEDEEADIKSKRFYSCIYTGCAPNVHVKFSLFHMPLTRVLLKRVVWF